MARDSPKHHQLGAKRRQLTWVVAVVGCVFYSICLDLIRTQVDQFPAKMFLIGLVAIWDRVQLVAASPKRIHLCPREDRCDITYILLEMDRILRPEGTVIFRDTVEALVKVQTLTNGMRWDSKIVDHESGPFNPEKILVAVKKYWTGEAPKKQQ